MTYEQVYKMINGLQKRAGVYDEFRARERAAKSVEVPVIAQSRMSGLADVLMRAKASGLSDIRPWSVAKVPTTADKVARGADTANKRYIKNNDLIPTKVKVLASDAVNQLQDNEGLRNAINDGWKYLQRKRSR